MRTQKLLRSYVFATFIVPGFMLTTSCGSGDSLPPPAIQFDAELSNGRFWIAQREHAVNPWNSKTGKAVTWRQLKQDDKVILVGADSSSAHPQDGTTNAYDGDTSLSRALPVLCISKDGSARPASLVTSPDAGWASGAVQLTTPVVGKTLNSREAADALCATTFGFGWRMAEAHDGIHNGVETSWRFYALGKLAFVSADARVLDSTARNQLRTFDPATGTLVFSGRAPNLQIGNVIVSEPSISAPYGIPPLRVTARHEDGDRTTIETVPSSLDEIIEEGDVEVSRPLAPDDLEQVDTAGNVQLQTWGPTLDGKVCKPTGLLGIKCEFQTPEGNSPVKLVGSFEFKARQEFALRFRKILRIKEFKVAVGLEENARLALEFSHNADLFDFETPIGQFRIKRWVFFIGPVPVTVEMYVKFKVGGNGNVSLAYEYSVNQSASLLYGYRYTYDKGWEKINEKSFDISAKEPSTSLKVNGAAKAYVAAVPGIGLYGPAKIIGAESDIGAVRAYAKLKTQYPGIPLWRVSAGLEFCNGLNLTIKLRLLIIKRDFEFKISDGSCAELELWKKEGGGSQIGTWTPWMNRDDSGGVGDFEDLANYLSMGQACPKPLAIECQTASGVDWKLAGQVYHCIPDLGGVCYNSEQPIGQLCLDYQVRFLCP